MKQEESQTNTRRMLRFWKVAFAFCGAAVTILAVGFVLFVSHVKNYGVPDTSVKADGIVVLTGGVARLSSAVELLRDGRGERLLISGVNENTSAETIKDVLSVDDELFECCVELDRVALDTIGNAQVAIGWARQNGFQSLLWVTNDYHMPRSLLEVTRIGGNEISITPIPVSNTTDSSGGWAAWVDRYRVLAGEYAKYLVALVRTPRVRLGINALLPGW